MSGKPQLRHGNRRATNAILLIGLGPHSERNHLPSLLREYGTGRLSAVVGFDVSEAAPRIERSLASVGMPLPVHYAAEVAEDCQTLPPAVADQLEGIVREYQINGVIVACEPSYHVPYVLWAMDRRLHTLVDKPMSVRPGSSVNSAQAQRILDDCRAMAERYARTRRAAPGLGVTVMCQRRYHPLYRRVEALVREVAERTTCPVTSMQSFHSDGQWRLPNELVEITYHSFDRGYGKIAHSGYHFIDFMSTTVRAGLGERDLDELEVFTSAVRPADYLAQLTPEAYPHFFDQPPFDVARIGSRLAPVIGEHGEVDAFISLGFRSRGRMLCLGSINLVHNGMSLRHSAVPDMTNLYRGTGRIRQENHIIEQGPFQAIHLHSFRSGDVGCNRDALGGEAHLELHVFRNNRLFPDWTPYERLTASEVMPEGVVWTDHQQGARAQAVAEFVDLLDGAVPPGDLKSDLLDHALGGTMLSGAYLSLARRAEGRSPAVTLLLK